MVIEFITVILYLHHRNHFAERVRHMFKTKRLFKPVFGVKPVVGLDIGTSSIKAVELRATSKGVELVNAGVVGLDLEPGLSAEERGKKIVEAIKRLFAEHAIKADRVVMAVSGESVIIRHLRFPPGSEDRVGQLIRYEASGQIPFPIDTVAMDYCIVGETDKGVDAILVAMKRELVEERMALVKDAGLKPVAIDVTSLALFNSLRFGREGKGVEAFIGIGATTTDICIQRDGILRFTRSVPIAGNGFTEAIGAGLHMDFKQAETLKREEGAILAQGPMETSPEGRAFQISEAISPVLGSLLTEIKRSFDYYQSQPEGAPVERVILSGGSARLRGLDKFFARELGLSVEIADPLNGIQVDSSRFDLKEITPFLAVPLGLALRGVDQARISINLLPAEVREEELARVRRRTLTFAGLLAVLAIGLSAVLIFQKASQRMPQIKRVEDELAKMEEGIAEKVERLTREKLDLEHRMTVSMGLVRRRVSRLDLLCELTSLVPADVWLEDLSFGKDGKMRMRGKAFSRAAVANLMINLGNSVYFENIGAPNTTTSKGSVIIAFNLDCTVVTRGQPPGGERP